MTRRKTILILTACCAALLAACGIESFVYLYPITYRDFEPSSDSNYNYFSFRTSDEKNESESSGYFRGFEIYYRIYNNNSTRLSDKSLINNYNTNNPTTAYTYLLSTKLYRRLSCTVRPDDMPLIPGSNGNRQVIIRLYGTPIRTNDGTGPTDKLFDLDEIDNGDSDFTYSSSWDTNGTGKKLAYVEAYAVAYGYDESYKSLYSELFELGYITLTDD